MAPACHLTACAAAGPNLWIPKTVLWPTCQVEMDDLMAPVPGVLSPGDGVCGNALPLLSASLVAPESCRHCLGEKT